MQQLLSVLETLPDIAMKNCTITQGTHADFFLETSYFLFGHRVNMNPVEKAEFDLKRKQQIITDWKEAAQEIKTLCVDRGFPAPVVVPLHVFHKTCHTCELVLLEDMKHDGTIFLNPFAVDYLLTMVVPMKLRLDFFEGIKGINFSGWWNKHNTFWETYNYQNTLKFPGPSVAVTTKNETIVTKSEYVLGDKNFFSYFLHTNKEKREGLITQFLLDFEDKTKEFDSSYKAYTWLRAERVLGDSPLKNILKGKVVFPSLPKEYQQLLIQLKKNLPHWPVYTAADPAYFRCTYNDEDILEYVQKRISFWRETFSFLVEKVRTYEALNDAFQKTLFEELQKQGIHKKYDHVILSHEELLRAIEIEKDPIFYMPVQKVHRHVRYDFAVVYGQVGSSPKEKAAIDMLQRIDHQSFCGVAAN